MNLFCQFWAARHISRTNCAEKNYRDRQGQLCVKFSAVNVDFDNPNLDFLGSGKPVHKGIKEWYPHKSRYFTTVGQFPL